MHTTVLVIGGGATGVGIARDLALRGVDTTLVERGALAAGTSGRSHGVLHSGARYAEADADDAAACLAENRILREIAPDCISETGGYFLHLDSDDPAYFERKREACEALGMAVETLSGDEMRAREPTVSDRVERALAVPDGVVSPARLLVATAAAAREAGARLYTHSPVENIHVAEGAVTGATVGGRLDTRVDADIVVNATGPWAERCAALAGVSVPMAPTRGVMVAVDNPGVDAVLNRCRPPADGDIVVPRDGTAVLGTTSVAVDDPDDFERTEAEVERTVTECAAMCPGVDGPVERTYWGVRPLYAPDEAARGDARAISRGFALLDHADEGAAGLVTVVGGKLTTHRRMAAVTADRVCERLGVDAACHTVERPLPSADDPVVDAVRADLGVDAPAN
ncbi:FAD-dependent oxidoreductase [Haloplanus sp. C73]|uniref:FAD-dependent oxidoreductase n=1 Tax=Haloplanus sp. C73 TaxID=3421641 RepID=UPI003EBC0F74